MGALRAIAARVDTVLLGQRGHLLHWSPVFFGLGIGVYFALRVEPGMQAYLAVGCLGALCGVIAALRPGGWAALFWAVTLTAAGFTSAGWRAASVAAPVLDFRYYGPVEGRVVGIDRSNSDAVRVTLDQVRLPKERGQWPDRVRISFHGGFETDVAPGQRIMTTGYLSPPQGPVEPGGFDFRRQAWFDRLGAVGYTRNPVLTIAPPEEGQAGLFVFAVRMALSLHVREALPGDVGGFAAAVTTGDRSGMSRASLDALRASNTAHLLAISGLHMGLLAGFVFACLRIGMAAIPPLALRAPVRKIAALGALGAGAVYLALSGGNVATERAFIMVAMALIAVLFERRALTLRAVALAAMVVLFLRPEALLSPGFQMSFAATTALVAVFGWMRDAELPKLPRWLKPVSGVFLSSAIAGAATAPVAAAHFNTVSHYGLVANLLAVPVMGTVVVPAAVLAACLAPLGLSYVGLWIMGWGLRFILAVAHWVSGFDGARSFVESPAGWVLPVFVLGALWVILWQGRARHLGIADAVIALVSWGAGDRPKVLISDSGGLVGVMTGEGRALSKSKGDGFVAQVWLENDGDGTDQMTAAARWPGPESKVRVMPVGATQVVHVIGKRGLETFPGCEAGQIVVVSVPARLDGDCLVLDPVRLRATGSMALSGEVMTSASATTGRRLWSPGAPGLPDRLAWGQ